MASELRTYLQRMKLDELVEDCHRQTGLSRDSLKDAALEVLARMLQDEWKWQGRFENPSAFFGYIRKSSIRRVIASTQEAQHREGLLKRSWDSPDVETPEQQLFAVLECEAFSDLLARALHKAGESEGLLQEGKQLVTLILSDPERFIKRRQSGKNKDVWVLHYVELVKELGWNKQRVYDRLERIRTLIARELRKQEETQ